MNQPNKTTDAAGAMQPAHTEQPRPELIFDGCGMNGPDEHRTRLATFHDWNVAKKYGPLFAAAPDLLAALEQCLPIIDRMRRMSGGEGDITAMNARAVIAKATGTTP